MAAPASDLTPHAAASFLAALALALVAAKAAALACARMRQSAVVGEILAGILVGPYVLGRVSPFHVDPAHPAFILLAEIGVVLLMFEIGLETDLGKMLESGLSSTLVALIGVVVPLALGIAGTLGLIRAGWISADSSFAGLLGLFVGATLVATSVGVTARVLRDLGRMATTEARILLGAAVLDDVLGLVILAVVSGVGAAATAGLPLSEAISPGLVGGKLAIALGFLVAAVLVGRAMAPRIFDAITRLETRGLLVTGTFAFVLGLAFLADRAGSALIIGGFAAGLVLSSTRQAGDIEHEMRPLSEIFAPLFFLTVGASVNVTSVNPFDRASWPTLGVTAVLLVIAIAGKLVAGLGVVERGGKVRRLAVGMGMVPRGEVGLIFAQAGAAVTVSVGGVVQPLVSGSLHAALTLVVLLTTLAGPPALRRAFEGKEPSAP